jgi:hypothetical protein
MDHSKPQWWQLYVLLLAVIGLFLMIIQLHLPPVDRTAAYFGIVWTAYGCFNLWLATNHEALDYEARSHAKDGTCPTSNNPLRGKH